ncbi:MAG: hypothetical protein IKB59_02175, partial [Alphaproteobacteria bacterium]|nr:hypothetical protein [Alphaproteobacteria bacterium]
MKKFFVSLFVFACFVGIGGEVLAACGVKSMKMSGFQYKYDDEFLYENENTYNKVGDANGEYTGLPGNVYECDNEHCAS